MFIKQQLISEIEHTENLTVIVQLFEILQLIKQTTNQPNPHPLWQLIGCLDDTEAQALRQMMTEEFGHIEGEW